MVELCVRKRSWLVVFELSLLGGDYFMFGAQGALERRVRHDRYTAWGNGAKQLGSLDILLHNYT